MGGVRKTQTTTAPKNHWDHGLIYRFIILFNIPEDRPKRAILGAQESAKIAPESYLELSYRCLGAIKSSRYV